MVEDLYWKISSEMQVLEILKLSDLFVKNITLVS